VKVSKEKDSDAGHDIDEEIMINIVESLRYVLGWLPGEMDNDKPKNSNSLEPFCHSVGYSLGGFQAQSIFFTWPFAISSCVSLFSGGALWELSPTAFADREE